MAVDTFAIRTKCTIGGIVYTICRSNGCTLDDEWTPIKDVRHHSWISPPGNPRYRIAGVTQDRSHFIVEIEGWHKPVSVETIRAALVLCDITDAKWWMGDRQVV